MPVLALGLLSEHPAIGSSTREAASGARPGPDAARVFVETYQDLVVNTCFHFVRDIDDAHDIAQEVLLAALRLIPQLSADHDWRAWLYRTASNRSLNALRARKRRRWLRPFHYAAGEHRDNLRNVAGAELRRPDRVLENAELQLALDSAIAALPPRQCVAFTLHLYEGLAGSEIAEIMLLKINAVDALLHRARTHLRKRLLKQYQEFLDK